MIDNKELIDQLHEVLSAFNDRLDVNDQSICAQDIAILRHALIDALNNTRNLKVQKLFSERSYNFLLKDVVPLIKEIIDRIDQEEKSIETEMHGTQNYSRDESKKIKTFAHKEAFKETLLIMLFLIRRERAELTHADYESMDNYYRKNNSIMPFIK